MISTLGHDHDAELDPPRVQEVSDGVFAYIQPDGTWFINNTTASARSVATPWLKSPVMCSLSAAVLLVPSVTSAIR